MILPITLVHKIKMNDKRLIQIGNKKYLVCDEDVTAPLFKFVLDSTSDLPGTEIELPTKEYFEYCDVMSKAASNHSWFLMSLLCNKFVDVTDEKKPKEHLLSLTPTSEMEKFVELNRTLSNHFNKAMMSIGGVINLHIAFRQYAQSTTILGSFFNIRPEETLDEQWGDVLAYVKYLIYSVLLASVKIYGIAFSKRFALIVQDLWKVMKENSPNEMAPRNHKDPLLYHNPKLAATIMFSKGNETFENQFLNIMKLPMWKDLIEREEEAVTNYVQYLDRVHKNSTEWVDFLIKSTFTLWSFIINNRTGSAQSHFLLRLRRAKVYKIYVDITGKTKVSNFSTEETPKQLLVIGWLFCLGRVMNSDDIIGCNKTDFAIKREVNSKCFAFPSSTEFDNIVKKFETSKEPIIEALVTLYNTSELCCVTIDEWMAGESYFETFKSRPIIMSNGCDD